MEVLDFSDLEPEIRAMVDKWLQEMSDYANDNEDPDRAIRLFGSAAITFYTHIQKTIESGGGSVRKLHLK